MFHFLTITIIVGVVIVADDTRFSYLQPDMRVVSIAISDTAYYNHSTGFMFTVTYCIIGPIVSTIIPRVLLGKLLFHDFNTL